MNAESVTSWVGLGAVACAAHAWTAVLRPTRRPVAAPEIIALRQRLICWNPSTSLSRPARGRRKWRWCRRTFIEPLGEVRGLPQRWAGYPTPRLAAPVATYVSSYRFDANRTHLKHSPSEACLR